jgi:hypothetical protein
MDAYRKNPIIKPMNVICITHGDLNDMQALEDVIVTCARDLGCLRAPKGQIGVQFIQVGDDRHATAALEKLDNDLAKRHDVRDMVDTVSYTTIEAAGGFSATGVLKAIMGAIDGKLDRKML